jgi:type III secretion protein Q
MGYSIAEMPGVDAAAERAAAQGDAHAEESAGTHAVQEVVVQSPQQGAVQSAQPAAAHVAQPAASRAAQPPAAQTGDANETRGMTPATGALALYAASPATVNAVSQTASIATLPLRAVPLLASRVARLVCDAGTAQRLARDAAIVDWQVTLEPAAERTRTPFEQPGVLDLAHAAGAVRVLFDLAAYPALDIAALPDGTLSRAPVPGDTARALRIAVAGVLLEPLLKRLAALGLGDMHVTQLARGTPLEASAHDCATFDATFSLDGTRHRARVLLAASVVDALEALHATRTFSLTADAFRAHASSQTQNNAPFDGCTVPGRLILGSRRLPVDTLRALEAGDVLLRSLPGKLRALLPASGAERIGETCAIHAADAHAATHATPLAEPATATASATVAWGSPGLMRVHAQVNIEGRRLSLTKEPIMTDELDPVRPDDLLATDQHSNPIDIGELDLPVQFEVDTVALPLSQLYALRPGYVLELPTPVADAQLKLVTHGQTIGYGELVTVGDHLGIRILRMAHGDGPVQ